MATDPINEEKAKVLYDEAGKYFDLGTYDEYLTKMQSPEKRKLLYDNISTKFDVGSYEEYEAKLKKKFPSTFPEVMEASSQRSNAPLPHPSKSTGESSGTVGAPTAEKESKEDSKYEFLKHTTLGSPYYAYRDADKKAEKEKADQRKKSLVDFYDKASPIIDQDNGYLNSYKNWAAENGSLERITYLEDKAKSEVERGRRGLSNVTQFVNKLQEDKRQAQLKGDIKEVARLDELIQAGFENIRSNRDVTQSGLKTETGLLLHEEAIGFASEMLNTKMENLLSNPDTEKKLTTLDSLHKEIQKNKPDSTDRASVDRYNHLIQKYNEILQDPEVDKVKKLADQGEKLVQSEKDLAKKFPNEFSKRLEKKAKQEQVDAMFASGKSAKIGEPSTSWIANQLGRSATGFVADVLKSWTVIDHDKKFGAADKFNSIVDTAVDYVNESAFPVPSDFNKPMMYQDENGNNVFRSDLILPKTAKVAGDMAALLYGAGKLSALGKAAGMSTKVSQGIGLFTSSYLQGHDDYKKAGQAAGMNPSDAAWFATAGAATTSALELISPSKYLWAADDLAKNVAKNITAGMSRREALKQSMKFVGQQTGAENLQEITQQFGDMLVESGANTLTGNNHFEHKGQDVLNEAVETMVVTTLVAGAPASVSAAANAANRNKNYRDAIRLAAENKEKYLPLLQNTFRQMGTSPAEIKSVMDAIDAVKVPKDGAPLYLINGQTVDREAIEDKLKKRDLTGIYVANDTPLKEQLEIVAKGGKFIRTPKVKVEREDEKTADGKVKKEDPIKYAKRVAEAKIKELVKTGDLKYNGKRATVLTEHGGQQLALIVEEMNRASVPKATVTEKTEKFDAALEAAMEKQNSGKPLTMAEAEMLESTESIAPKFGKALETKSEDVVRTKAGQIESYYYKGKRVKLGKYFSEKEVWITHENNTREVVPWSDVEVPLKENKTGKTQSFFTSVVEGTDEKFKPKAPWAPIMKFEKDQGTFREQYVKFAGNFDEHIATSIPGFRDIQIKKGAAISKMLPEGGLVYDIGGSEGGFVKAITQATGGKVKSINLDVNESMKKSHESSPVEGSEFVNEAFLEPYEEDGKVYPRHKPKQKADVVHESMVFQFISPERKQFIKEIKNNYMKEDGVVILEEKVVPESEEEWMANEEAKDTKHKSKYYTTVELQQKKEQVLTGMKQNQTADADLQAELLNNFDYVYQYWDSGNFKGYIASNNKAKVDAFVKGLGDTKTEFATRESGYLERTNPSEEINPETGLPQIYHQALKEVEDLFQKYKDGPEAKQYMNQVKGDISRIDDRAYARIADKYFSELSEDVQKFFMTEAEAIDFEDPDKPNYKGFKEGGIHGSHITTLRDTIENARFEKTKESESEVAEENLEVDTIKEIMTKAMKALSKLRPDLQVLYYNGEAEGREALQKAHSKAKLNKGALGFYAHTQGVIGIDLSKADATTAFHESTHVVIDALKELNPELFKKLSATAATQEIELEDGSRITFAEYMGGNKEEALVEFLADFADGKFDEINNPSIATTIKNIISQILEALGLKSKDFNIDLDNIEDLKDFAEQLATALSKGKTINLESKSKAITNKKKRKKVSTQTPATGKKKKLNRTAKRIAYDKLTQYKKLQEDIVQNTENHMYTPQELKKKVEKLEKMTLDDVVVETQSSDKLLEALQQGNQYAVLSAIELLKRKNALGEDTRPIFKKLRELGTSVGQLLRQFSELKTRSAEGIVSTVLGNLESMNMTPTEEQTKELTKLAEEHISALNDLDSKRVDFINDASDKNLKGLHTAEERVAKSFYNLNLYTGKITPLGLDSIIPMILQGNLLVVKSIVTNVISNVLYQPLRESEMFVGDFITYVGKKIKGEPVANPFEMYFGSVLHGIIAFGKNIPVAVRDVARGRGAEYISTMEVRRNLKPLQALGQIFTRAGRSTLPVNTKGKVPISVWIEKALEGTVGWPAEAMFRMLYLGDKPFREAARSAAAYRLYTERGGKGTTFTPGGNSRFRQFMANASKKDLLEMQEQAEEATSSNERTLSKMGDGFMRWVGQNIDLIADKSPNTGFRHATKVILKVLAKANTPYVRVPANLLQYLIELALPVIPLYAAVSYGVRGDARKAMQFYTRAITGYMLQGAVDMMYDAGILLASGEDDDENERQLKHEVARPNGLNLSAYARWRNGGDATFRETDHVIEFTKLGYFGMYMAYRAEFNESVQKELKMTRRDLDLMTGAVEQFNSVVGAALEMSFLQGSYNMLKAFDKGGFQDYGGELMNTLSAIAIPNNVSVVSRVTSNYILRANDKEALNSFVEKQKVKLFPTLEKLGLSDGKMSNVYPIIGMFGEPALQTPKGRNPIIYHFFNITNDEKITDPVSLEVFNLSKRVGDVPISAPSDRVKIGLSMYTLTEQDYTYSQMIAGQYKRIILENMMASPDWKTWGDVEKKMAMETANEGGNDLARTYMVALIHQGIEAGQITTDDKKGTYNYVQPSEFDYNFAVDFFKDQVQ